MTKASAKTEAIRLRVEEKLSISEIKARLGVSKGSLSGWLREYPLDKSAVSRRVADANRRRSANLPPQQVPPVDVTENTTIKGHIAVLHVEQRALGKGWIVSRPTTDAPYDLILDNGEERFRAQVKYADGRSCVSSGAVIASLGCRKQGSKHRSESYSRKDVDVVLVYVPAADKILWLNHEIFEGHRTFCVRLKPTRNSQKKGVNFVDNLAW